MSRKPYLRLAAATRSPARLAAVLILVIVNGAWVTLHPEPEQVQAQGAGQVMYYIDVGASQSDNASGLYRVTLSSDRADLKIELAGIIPIDTAALAATPDGTRLYMVDLDTAIFGYYDASNGIWSGKQGTIRTPAGTALSTVQAAFSPAGELYIVSPSDDRLRVVNLTCPSTDCGKATPVGTIVEKNSKKIVNVSGGDIVFDGSTLYIWANRGNTADAPRGLYMVDPVVATDGKVETTYVGGSSVCPHIEGVQAVTGMTVDSTDDPSVADDPYLVLSCSNNGSPNLPGLMYQVRKRDASVVASFTMRRTSFESNFVEHGADMTTGPDVSRPTISATNLTLLDGGAAEGLSRIYEVTLDSASGQAKLKILPGGIVPGDSAAVAGISSTPDGDRLYYVSSGLRYYDFSTESVVTIGPILSGSTEVTNTAQAAFSPTDQLYIGGDAGTIKNALFRVEYLCNGTIDCANATYVGTVKRGNATVDVSGADIVFANATTLYLWANSDATGAPRGLYRLTLPAQEGTVVNAEYLSTSTTKSVCSSDAFISGLALDPDGNLLASCVTNSTTTADQIFTISTTNGAVVEGSRFKMHLSGFGGRIFVHTGGDLTGAPGDSPLPPVAQSQSVSTAQDTGKQITLQATDVDSSSLSFSIVGGSGPSHGTLSAIDAPACTSSGGITTCTATVTYSPDSGFTGNDGFAFTATDSPTNLSSTAQVSISVTADANVPPLAADQTETTDEDTPVTITLSGIDTDNASLAFTIVTGPVNGSLSPIDAPSCTTDSGTTTCKATVLYSPATNFNGADSFTYTAHDGLDGSNLATVSITVNPANDPPIANDDFAETDEDVPVIVDVLANDEDMDGNTLTITAATFASNGDVLIDPSLQFVTYTPSAGFTGTDTFTYTISDGEHADEATVTITVAEVNDPPAAVNDAYATAEDTVLVVELPGVLGNDTDPEGALLLAEIVGEPSQGDLLLNPDGSFSYIPAPNFNGTDSFTYQASDGAASSGIATVTITVTPVNDAPVVSAGGPYTVDEGSSIALDASGDDVDGDPLSYEWDLDNDGIFETPRQSATFSAAEIDGPALQTVQVRVTDGDLAAVSETLITINNVAPSITIDGAPSSGSEGATLHLSSTVSDPAPADTHSYAWSVLKDGQPFAAGDGSTFSFTPDDNGEYTISMTVTDDDGGVGTDSLTITVDNVAPMASLTVASGTINEGGSGTVTLGGQADASTVDQVAGFTYAYDCTDDGLFEVANSAATTYACQYPENGVFTVRGRITDKDGGYADYTVEVTVLNVAPAVGAIIAPLDPQKIDTTITASATFTDPGVLDTHTASWDWGDGSTSPGTVTPGSGSGSVTGSHSYVTPGVYRVRLTVTDDDGDSGESVFEYVVVYDPNGGFVTGGGWIWSPAGAYVADSELEGKASFGFVARYKKGATVPEGKTEFQFRAGNLNFHSTNYQWLVVSGARAQFKGTGTINGEGSYGFMLTAIDGQVSGGGDSDKFRIKIWLISPDGSDGPVVYDNQLGAAADADPTTVIGGGSIVIHKQ